MLVLGLDPQLLQVRASVPFGLAAGRGQGLTYLCVYRTLAVKGTPGHQKQQVA